MADLLGTLDRSAAPPDLGRDVLDAYAARQEPTGGTPVRHVRVVGLMILLLLVVGVGGVDWGQDRDAGEARRGSPSAVERTPSVVDDPSVPLYPGLDSFGLPSPEDGAGPDAPWGGPEGR